MADPTRDEAPLESIDRSLLPSLSLALDALLETASLARPGADAESHAASLRALASELNLLGSAFATLALPPAEDYSAAA